MFKYKYFFLVISFLSVRMAFCMEFLSGLETEEKLVQALAELKAGASGSQLQTISSWEDVKPFAGCIVTYQTDSRYVGTALGSGNSWAGYGMIQDRPWDWHRGGYGYDMNKLLNKGEVGMACALSNEEIHGRSLRLGIPSVQELEQIRADVEEERARFTLYDKSEMVQALSRQIRCQSGLD